MKLSAYHQSNGLVAQILLPSTGESLSLNLYPGQTKVPVLITIGGHAFEGTIDVAVVLCEDPQETRDVALGLTTKPAPGRAPKREVKAAPLAIEDASFADLQGPTDDLGAEPVALQPAAKPEPTSQTAMSYQVTPPEKDFLAQGEYAFDANIREGLATETGLVDDGAPVVDVRDATPQPLKEAVPAVLTVNEEEGEPGAVQGPPPGKPAPKGGKPAGKAAPAGKRA